MNTPKTDAIFAPLWAKDDPWTDEELHEITKSHRRLERENLKLREGLEKFRGQFDCYECTGTAEEILDYLDNSQDQES